MSARLRLRRSDGIVYLDRWGWECRWFGVFLHRMDGPDPGLDFHDHPWSFASLVLRGGYVEERAAAREASHRARMADDAGRLSVPVLSDEEIERLKAEFRALPAGLAMILDEESTQASEIVFRGTRGDVVTRRRWSVRVMRLDECHRIISLNGRRCWTLVIHGPKRGTWGFYLPTGWVDWITYDRTVRAERRDLYAEGQRSDGFVRWHERSVDNA